MASIDRRTFVKAATAAGVTLATGRPRDASASVTQAAFMYEPGYSGPGSFGHGDIVTIRGGGFGSKATATPLVWDDASGAADVRDLWYEAWPNACSDASRNTRRRNVFPGVPAPHDRVGRYIAGAHAESGATAGQNVLLWYVMRASLPMDIYASAWVRCDPAWVFKNDNNFKCFYWRTATNSTPSSPISAPGISFEFNPRPSDLSPTFKGWRFYSSGAPDLSILNTNGQVYPDGQFLWVGTQDILNPMSQWIKYEYVFRFGASGFLRIFENGRQVSFYNGHTDTNSASHRSFTFGAFARAYNEPGNFRYFTDCYLDTSFARIMLINSPTFNASPTVREMQLPLAWSSGEIIFNCWQGAHQSLSGVSLYIVKPNNTPLKIGTFL